MAIPTIPTTELKGADVERYIRNLTTVIRRARLNQQYPDPRLLISHLEVLSPTIHRGLYPTLDIDERSGLPTYREWTRVQTDVGLAEKLLRQLGSEQELRRRAKNSGDPIHAKQLTKHAYYSDLFGRKTAPLGDMQVALRRVDPEEETAHFHVILDKLDASGVFVRYSVDLSQQSSAWTRPMVVLDDETAHHTEGLKALVYRFSSLDSELTFANLVTTEGLGVERVCKGTIGPVFWGQHSRSSPLKKLLDAHPESVIATFALDMASVDVAADRHNDPLEAPMISRLSGGAQNAYQQARKRVGFHVYKDRKFVVSSELVDQIHAFCTAKDTQNIVYGF